MGCARRVGIGLAMITAAVALGAGGCARFGHDWPVWETHRHGSIKDDAPTTSALRRPAPPARPSRPAATRPMAAQPRPAPPAAPGAALPSQRDTLLTETPPAAAPVPPAPERPIVLAPATPTPDPVAPAPDAPPADTPAPPASVPAAPAAPPAPRTAETADPALATRLLDEGRALFSAGRVIDARKRYIGALDGPVPEALLALARSYDPHYLGQVPKPDGTADVERARTLYQRALDRGAKDAAADLARLDAR